MASLKLRKVAQEDDESPKMDMSPMIDMVFLLLIFFMVTSRLIIIKQDPEVEPPVAEGADPLADAINRLVINVFKDGTLKTEHGDPLSLEELEARSREMTERLKGTGRKARLHIRGDRRSNVEELKKVIGAAARGGIDEVIVAAYRQNRYQN